MNGDMGQRWWHKRLSRPGGGGNAFGNDPELGPRSTPRIFEEPSAGPRIKQAFARQSAGEARKQADEGKATHGTFDVLMTEASRSAAAQPCVKSGRMIKTSRIRRKLAHPWACSLARCRPHSGTSQRRGEDRAH